MADKMVMGALYLCCDCGDLSKQQLINFHAVIQGRKINTWASLGPQQRSATPPSCATAKPQPMP